jgi:hypothetical protein
MITTDPANPWESLAAPALSVPDALYKNIMLILAVSGRSAEEVPVLAAVVALLEAGRDLMVASGQLWHSHHNLSDMMRDVADELDRIRAEEPPRPPLETLKETLESVRPKYRH